MYGVELYRWVRLAVVDGGLSHRQAALRFGIDRRTVKKMLSYSAPPGYRRSKPARRPKLEAEKRPAQLDLARYPHLPQPFVAAAGITDCATLLAGGMTHG